MKGFVMSGFPIIMRVSRVNNCTFGFRFRHSDSGHVFNAKKNQRGDSFNESAIRGLLDSPSVIITQN